MKHLRRLLGPGAIITLCCVLGPASMGAPVRKRVSGNLVFWDQSRGFDTIVANADVFWEISAFWYRVEPDGRVVPYTTGSGGTYVDSNILSFLRAQGILVLPTVANIINGVWDGASVSAIIGDPHLRAVNITNLVNLTITGGYDGIDLDYENLRATDRSAFTTFVRELATALHAQGKLLTVNVYAKTSERGTWDGPRAQDWQAIGQVVDQVRVMTYEYSWSTSSAGPISPVNWVSDVIAFARSQIAAEKIMQGVPFYGYDWVGQHGTDIVWTQAIALTNRYSSPVQWDSASASPWFKYRAGSTRDIVWFENAASVDAKLGVAAANDVSGVTVWRLGGEDPDNWKAMRSRFGGDPPAPDTTPPTVAITSPLDGAFIARKQRIEAQAADNVGVARVDFYVNNSLLASDNAAPYAVWWNTRRALSGANVIDAVAYDAAGNSSNARVTVSSR